MFVFCFYQQCIASAIENLKLTRHCMMTVNYQQESKFSSNECGVEKNLNWWKKWFPSSPSPHPTTNKRKTPPYNQQVWENTEAISLKKFPSSLSWKIWPRTALLNGRNTTCRLTYYFPVTPPPPPPPPPFSLSWKARIETLNAQCHLLLLWQKRWQEHLMRTLTDHSLMSSIHEVRDDSTARNSSQSSVEISTFRLALIHVTISVCTGHTDIHRSPQHTGSEHCCGSSEPMFVLFSMSDTWPLRN